MKVNASVIFNNQKKIKKNAENAMQGVARLVNQKRAAYVRMAIGLRGLERKCPLVCL